MARRASKRTTTAAKGAKRPTSARIAKAAVKRAAAKPTVKRVTMSPERRREMIAEAAYYRAERRRFQGGNPLEDWLMAEAEIDRAMRLRCRAARA